MIILRDGFSFEGWEAKMILALFIIDSTFDLEKKLIETQARRYFLSMDVNL